MARRGNASFSKSNKPTSISRITNDKVDFSTLNNYEVFTIDNLIVTLKVSPNKKFYVFEIVNTDTINKKIKQNEITHILIKILEHMVNIYLKELFPNVNINIEIRNLVNSYSEKGNPLIILYEVMFGNEQLFTLPLNDILQNFCCIKNEDLDFFVDNTNIIKYSLTRKDIQFISNQKIKNYPTEDLASFKTFINIKYLTTNIMNPIYAEINKLEKPKKLSVKRSTQKNAYSPSSPSPSLQSLTKLKSVKRRQGRGSTNSNSNPPPLPEQNFTKSQIQEITEFINRDKSNKGQKGVKTKKKQKEHKHNKSSKKGKQTKTKKRGLRRLWPFGRKKRTVKLNSVNSSNTTMTNKQSTNKGVLPSIPNKQSSPLPPPPREGQSQRSQLTPRTINLDNVDLSSDNNNSLSNTHILMRTPSAAKRDTKRKTKGETKTETKPENKPLYATVNTKSKSKSK